MAGRAAEGVGEGPARTRGRAARAGRLESAAEARCRVQSGGACRARRGNRHGRSRRDLRSRRGGRVVAITPDVRRRDPSALEVWTPAVAIAFVAAVAIATHANSLGNGLPLDAGALVQGNPALRALTWANLRTIFSSDYWSPMATNGLYRPLTTLSFLVNWTVLGNEGRPLGYHVVNVALHVACCCAALALFRRRGLPAGAAVLATLLFAVHPVTTEVVANVEGRADLLAALGVLLGVLCHARAVATSGGTRIAWEAA